MIIDLSGVTLAIREPRIPEYRVRYRAEQGAAVRALQYMGQDGALDGPVVPATQVNPGTHEVLLHPSGPNWFNDRYGWDGWCMAAARGVHFGVRIYHDGEVRLIVDGSIAFTIHPRDGAAPAAEPGERPTAWDRLAGDLL